MLGKSVLSMVEQVYGLDLLTALERIINWEKFNPYTYPFARVGKFLSSHTLDDKKLKLLLLGGEDSIIHVTIVDGMNNIIPKCDTLLALPSSPYMDGTVQGIYVVYGGKIRYPIAYAFNIRGMDDIRRIYTELSRDRRLAT